MSQRNKQHQGRSADPDPFEPDRVSPGDSEAGLDPVSAAEDAREISRILDENEGYERPEPRRQTRQIDGPDRS